MREGEGCADGASKDTARAGEVRARARRGGCGVCGGGANQEKNGPIRRRGRVARRMCTGAAWDARREGALEQTGSCFGGGRGVRLNVKNAKGEGDNGRQGERRGEMGSDAGSKQQTTDSRQDRLGAKQAAGQRNVKFGAVATNKHCINCTQSATVAAKHGKALQLQSIAKHCKTLETISATQRRRSICQMWNYLEETATPNFSLSALSLFEYYLISGPNGWLNSLQSCPYWLRDQSSIYEILHTCTTFPKVFRKCQKVSESFSTDT